MILKKIISILTLLALYFSLSTTSANAFSDEMLGEQMPHYATIPFGYIEYYRFGQGTPIVLIAGYGTDVTSWNKYFLAELAQHHDVIVFNNRNVAGSYVNSQRYDSKSLADDTAEFIQALGIKKASVLGLSMGGMIGLQLAVKYPELIDHLILMNTAIAGHESIQPNNDIKQLLLHLPNNKIGIFFASLKLFFPANARLSMSFALSLNRFLPKRYSLIQPGFIVKQQQHLLYEWAKDEETAANIYKIQLPVLLLQGDADAVIDKQNARVLSHAITNAKIIMWKNGGHGMMYQYPEELAQAVHHFIGPHI